MGSGINKSGELFSKSETTFKSFVEVLRDNSIKNVAAGAIKPIFSLFC